MNRTTAPVVLGAFLVAIGILMLLQNLGLLGITWAALIALLFAAFGLTFLAMFVGQADHWWAAIPGFTLLGLATTIGLETLGGRPGSTLGGAVFLGGTAVGFLVIYATRRDRWWAMIPGGILGTLSAMAGLSGIVRGQEAGALFFLGLALTFALVYLLPASGRRMDWALIPTGVFVVLAFTTAAATRSAFNYLWPVLLILAGLYLVFKARSSQRV